MTYEASNTHSSQLQSSLYLSAMQNNTTNSPKMLTRMALTCLSLNRMLKASTTCRKKEKGVAVRLYLFKAMHSSTTHSMACLSDAALVNCTLATQDTHTWLHPQSHSTHTCFSVAAPPTSRKFAGAPPCNLMMSMVAMARPAHVGI